MLPDMSVLLTVPSSPPSSPPSRAFALLFSAADDQEGEAQRRQVLAFLDENQQTFGVLEPECILDEEGTGPLLRRPAARQLLATVGPGDLVLMPRCTLLFA